MRRFIPVVATLGLLTACQASSDSTEQAANSTRSSEQTSPGVASSAAAITQQSETQRLNEWFADKYEQQLQNSPFMLTFLGRKEKYDQIDDVSEAAEKRDLAWQKELVAELKSKFDYDKLDVEGKISYDIWMDQYQQGVAGEKFVHNRYMFTQMQGIQAFAAQFLINFHKVDQESDMHAYNKRIVAVANVISTLLERAKLHASQGVRPPRFAYEGVIEQASALITGAPFTEAESDAALWADANRKVDALLADGKIDQNKAKQLKADAKQALLNSFLPSYQALVAWFKQDIENTAEIASGVGSQPNGKDYYNFMLKTSTTTDLTAEQIHQIGLTEVARITKEMEAIKDKVGFKGTLQEFFEFVKTDRKFFYSDDDSGRLAYISDTENFYLDIDKQLPKYFGILPKAGLDVKRVESFREQPGAAAHYNPGTPDGSRSGTYYLHLSDMNAMPKNELESVAYHEGKPGHHMQISIAQELTSVPQFRTQANFNAYSEGWGLYSELLAKEMGGYQDPYSDFGRLVNEIWRAVRLVVDTGLHAKGWNEQQAIDYFTAKVPTSATTIKSEVRRYIVLPGQATGYKIGMLKIQELRANAEMQLADKFDIRGFHDTILGGGAMPLSILERRVDEWITRVKAG